MAAVHSNSTTVLTPFHFDTHEVRIHLDDKNDPWWEAQDVCSILGIKNVGEAVARLKLGEKRTGETANRLIINEKGLYRLIMRSNKPHAERFQDWVFGEVLPQIRKYGSYTAEPVIPRLHDPRMQMLMEAVIRMDSLEQQLVSTKDDLISNQQATIAAQSDALQAKELALVALRNQAWVTIRQYVYTMHRDLQPLMPEGTQKAFARHLGIVCRERGAPMYKALTADTVWPDERTYPVGMVDELLPAWMQRQSAQIRLVEES